MAALLRHPAWALKLEENPALEQQYNAVCESRAVHDQLIQDMVAEMERGAAETPPELHAKNVATVSAMPCPVCGCKLGPMDPYPARF